MTLERESKQEENAIKSKNKSKFIANDPCDKSSQGRIVTQCIRKNRRMMMGLIPYEIEAMKEVVREKNHSF